MPSSLVPVQQLLVLQGLVIAECGYFCLVQELNQLISWVKTVSPRNMVGPLKLSDLYCKAQDHLQFASSLSL